MIGPKHILLCCFLRRRLYTFRRSQICVGSLTLTFCLLQLFMSTNKRTVFLDDEAQTAIADLSSETQAYVLQYRDTCNAQRPAIPQRTRRRLQWFFPENNSSFLSPATMLTKKSTKRPYCPCLVANPATLDPDSVDEFSALPWEIVERLHPTVRPGGEWSPAECVARHRVAVIVPYRDREAHLKAFLTVLHSFLQKQHVHYRIFVIEQHAPHIFNRASLLNIGFLEARVRGPFDCYIYHDVDLLPESDLNFYSCFRSPLHLGAYMNKFHYKLPYAKFFGGAMALTARHMEAINGFPNSFYGWGGEDDVIYARLLQNNLTVVKHPTEIAKTFMIKHPLDQLNPINPHRHENIETADPSDGLSSLVYTVNGRAERRLYTLVLATVERQPDPTCQLSDTSGYLNCYREENFIDGLLDCCRGNHSVYCCNKFTARVAIISRRSVVTSAAVVFLIVCAIFIAAVFVRRQNKRRAPGPFSSPHLHVLVNR